MSGVRVLVNSERTAAIEPAQLSVQNDGRRIVFHVKPWVGTPTSQIAINKTEAKRILASLANQLQRLDKP